MKKRPGRLELPLTPEEDMDALFQKLVSALRIRSAKLVLENNRVEIYGPPNYRPYKYIVQAVEQFQEQLKQRLKKPKYWPRDIPLPHWWWEVALCFRIKRAKRWDCPHCQYVVAVLTYDADGVPGWYCLRCGRKLSNGTEKKVIHTQRRINQSNS